MRFVFSLLSVLLIATPVLAEAPPQLHASSLFGTPKYQPGFRHFDYVNPDARKGGEVRVASFGNYDSFNPFILKGSPAEGSGLLHDTLMVSSYDEAGSQYGLIAETISFPPDYAWVSYTLRNNARFHDGTPVTPQDVVWTFDSLMANHPFYRAYYRDVEKAEVTGPNSVKFSFAQSGNRELPQIVGQLPVLSKQYWTAENRDIGKTTLTPPLGNGPYKIGKFEAGRYVVYQRVADYWAKDLNVNIGKYNFDRLRYDSFTDLTVAFEAFKAGALDFRSENNSKNWATGYNIPAVENGGIILSQPVNGSVQGMQGFIFNTRRAQFADLRVRQAFNHAFDFEWANKTLFYGQYVRTDSYFDNSELAATGLPSKEELALLTPLKDRLPETVFTTAYRNPVNDGAAGLRGNLRRAKELLAQAGWQVENGKLTKNGAIFKVEFLLVQPAFERIVGAYLRNLERLGITASIRIIDVTQYQNRVMEYDFDMIVHSFGQSLSPGNEQRNYWNSASADQTGGRNLIGIKEPAIDRLVEHIIFATDRQAQITATKALDRVLLAQHYVVPHWHIPTHRLAFWRGLKHPDTLPLYNNGFPHIWWRQSAAPYETAAQ